MLRLQNERHYGAGKFYIDLFLGHLQPGVDKNSEGLAIFILEFDDFGVKTLYKRPHCCLLLVWCVDWFGCIKPCKEQVFYYHTNCLQKIIIIFWRQLVCFPDKYSNNSKVWKLPLHLVTLNTFLDRIWAQSLRAMPYTRSLAMPPSKNLKKKIQNGDEYLYLMFCFLAFQQREDHINV